MPTTPAARPSRPSMKLTALITTTMNVTVRITDHCWPRISVPEPGIGSQSNCTPCNTMTDAARIWPASFVTASRLNRSSRAPMTNTTPPPSSSARGSEKRWLTTCRVGILDATSNAAAIPANIAAPPRRGVGLEWTSRSRTPVMAPILTATRRTMGVDMYVTAAATSSVIRYSRTAPLASATGLQFRNDLTKPVDRDPTRPHQHRHRPGDVDDRRRDGDRRRPGVEVDRDRIAELRLGVRARRGGW